MRAQKVWNFVTKKEALKKAATFKATDLYVINQNRNDVGKFVHGWKLEKLN